MTQRKPDFFIVGAPKCGTTALYSYLKDHPDIFMPEEKEPHFFCTDLPDRQKFTRLEDYLTMFTGADRKLVGEASTWYLYSTDAIANIMRVNKDARLIAMLRNPADMAHSLYFQNLYNVNETEQTFADAWQLQDARAEGKRVPDCCRHPDALQYRRACSFSAQLSRLFEHVPEEQRLIILYEDFAARPKEVYKNALRFLGLPDDDRNQFARVNAAKEFRSDRLARLLRRPPFPLNRLERPLRTVAHAVGMRPLKFVDRLNVRGRAHSKLDGETRRKLYGEFADDIGKVERLLGRPLDCWRPWATGL